MLSFFRVGFKVTGTESRILGDGLEHQILNMELNLRAN